MSEDIEVKKKQIKEELEQLNREFKIDLPKRIAEARAYGDLKENAEYDAAKNRQAFVQARIGQLSNQLNQLSSLDLSDIQKDRVGFGSQVLLEDMESGEIMELTFVSPNEVNPSQGKISLSSPFGQAMQNRVAGDIVEVNSPSGKKEYRIKKLTTIHGDIQEHK